MTTGTRIDLSLADLERNDPRARSTGNQRRFRCPLDACDGATYHGSAQPLAVNMTTGAWICHRCASHGLLTDYRTHGTSSKRDRMYRAIDTATRLRPVTPPVAEPKPDTWPWRDQWDHALQLTSPGALRAAMYVMDRGISWGPAHDAGVRFHDRFGTQARGPAVVFPLSSPQPDGSWLVTGLQGRYIDGRERSGARKVQTGGTGVFVTPGAVQRNDRIVICEGPFDALALAQWPRQPRPAIAVGGTNLPKWLQTQVLGRTIVLAHDSDDAGDKAAERHATVLRAWGARVQRKRPRAPYKDWAEEAQERDRMDRTMMRKVTAGHMQGDAPGPDTEMCETGTCENDAVTFDDYWGHLCRECRGALTAPARTAGD